MEITHTIHNLFSDPSNTKLIVDYATYLINRLRFNQRYTMFEGNFSIDIFVQSQPLVTMEKSIGKEAPYTYVNTTSISFLRL